MADRIPGAERLVLHDAGHIGNEQQPLVFTEKVGRFLLQALRAVLSEPHTGRTQPGISVKLGTRTSARRVNPCVSSATWSSVGVRPRPSTAVTCPSRRNASRVRLRPTSVLPVQAMQEELSRNSGSLTEGKAQAHWACDTSIERRRPFPPPKAPPISAPEVPMFTFAMDNYYLAWPMSANTIRRCSALDPGRGVVRSSPTATWTVAAETQPRCGAARHPQDARRRRPGCRAGGRATRPWGSQPPRAGAAPRPGPPAPQ